MLIGILQCGHFPTADGFPERTYTDLYSTLLADRGLTFRTWSVVDMEFPDGVHDADGWLVTGSRFGAYEDMPFIAPLEDFIRTCFAENVPLVGICFGHQIIAQAMGGKVEKFAGGWSVGATDYDFGGDIIPLNAWHQDQVTEAPEGARTIASSDFCEHAAFLYDGHAFTVQPHPEFDRGAVDFLLRVRAPGVVSADRIEEAEERLDTPVQNARIADRIADFFKENSRG